MSVMTDLKKLFKVTVKKQNKVKQIYPATMKKDNLAPAQFPPSIQKLYDYYMSSNLGNMCNSRDRFSRYDAMETMLKNSDLIQLSMDMYSDEGSQQDSDGRVISVTTKNSKFSKYLYEKFERWGLNQSMIKDMLYNIALYGDAFAVNGIDPKEGVISLTTIDVRAISDRLEFNALQVNKQLVQNNRGFASMISKSSVMELLANSLSELNDPSQYFQSYLFGFVVDDEMVFPPWGVTHMRLYSSQSEFFPFGRPLLINSMSAFSQLKTAKDLMVMARVSKFPKEHFEIKVNDTMSEDQQWEAVNEARQEYMNLGQEQQQSDSGMAVGGSIWTPEGLISYNLIENRMNLDDIADVENLELSMMRPTAIPLDLITNQGGGWQSNSSLVSQSKMFGRKVFSIQSALLQGITQLIKTDLAITKAFPVDEPFELAMNFPVPEESSDKLRLNSDTLSLAKTIADDLGTALGLDRGEALPTDVVADIYKTYSFLPSDDVDKWVKEFEKTKVENETDFNEGFRLKLKEKLKKLDENMFNRCLLEAKKKRFMNEGALNGKHYYCSFTPDVQSDITIELLQDQVTTVDRSRKLAESANGKKLDIDLELSIVPNINIEESIKEEKGEVYEIDKGRFRI